MVEQLGIVPGSSPGQDTPVYESTMAREMEAWGPYIDWSVRLQAEGILVTRGLVRAFREVPRYDFLPEDEAKKAGYNGPIDIGYGQTNSQPRVVGRMLELLQPRPGHNVLDFGAGSAWTTGLLHAVVSRRNWHTGRRGRVIGTEAISELVVFGNTNLAKHQFQRANVVHTPGPLLGRPEGAPFHRILVSARLPEEWVPELTVQLHPRGGKMVAPVCSTMADFETGGRTQDLVVITRHGANFTRVIARRRVSFVPTVRAREAA